MKGSWFWHANIIYFLKIFFFDWTKTMEKEEKSASHTSKVLAVIPAYNEGQSIGHIISSVRKKAPGLGICVVDDGSTDDTYQEALQAGACVLKHPYNMGYASACQTGFRYAMEEQADIVLQMDADGQHEPSSIPNVLAPVEAGDCDICIGSRFLAGGTYRTTFPKRLGMRLFAWIASIVTGKKITDPTSGFLAFNDKVLTLYCSDVYPDDYPDANLIVVLHLAGMRVMEAPVRMFPNFNKSMHGFFSAFFYVLVMLLYITISLFSRRYILSKLRQDKRKAVI